jgi:hypothetical protein
VTEIVGTDPRFPRARCEHCTKLYPHDQTGIYLMVRVADSTSKRVRLCFVCAHTMPIHFTVVRLLD